MEKLVIAVATVVIGLCLWRMFSSGPSTPPKIDPDEWWGPKELKTKKDESIRPFKIKFDEAMITDLKQRLKNHRPFTPPLEGVAFEYGFNTANLDGWLKYWAEEYPFAERENFLNKYPQFKTNIKGLDIHFIRVKPQAGTDALPPQYCPLIAYYDTLGQWGGAILLCRDYTVPTGVQTVPILLMHGWPGSVREFYEAIPLLTNVSPGYDFVFEVVVPSLPGYGFSDAAVRPGLAIPQVADIFRILMQRLGHEKFYVQGGDWGAGIASGMATLFPDVVLGLHSNLAMFRNKYSNLKTLLGAFIPSLVVERHLADRMYPLSSLFSFIMEEFGYFHIQTTKPDTVGVSLTDSPAGLLAYILEKFSTWTRKEHKYETDGGLTFRFTKEKLIDNLMIYWSTNTITTSMRFYAENWSKKNRDIDIDSYTTPVPTWALQAKHELVYQPPALLKIKCPNLLNTTVLEDGGHFLALELPEILVADVYKAVKAFKEWHKANTRVEL